MEFAVEIGSGAIQTSSGIQKLIRLIDRQRAWRSHKHTYIFNIREVG
jgi:hypothetical protein